MKKTIQWLCCVSLLTSPLHAATFVVTNLMDTGLGSFRQAILDANATAGDDAIEFATNGVIILSSQLPTLTDNTTIAGPGTNQMTISGSNKFRIFSMGNGTTNTLSGLTIANGYSEYWFDIGFVDTYASGIANTGTLRMVNCLVQNCTNSFSSGAGIYNVGTLEMESCLLADCFGWATKGGGIHTVGTLRMKDCVIARCRADGSGGGIYNGGGILALTNTIIEDCRTVSATDGGGINTAGGIAMLHSCVIRRCGGYWAGGIRSSGMLIMTNTTVANNSAGDYGGGVLLFGSGVFSGCSLYSNRCGNVSGGAILNAGALELYNCTISRNQGASQNVTGTGISDNYSANGVQIRSTYLNHCTVVANFGGLGEVHASTNFTAVNSILGDCNGTLQSGGFNLIANTNGCTINGDTTGNILSLDPQLGPLQNNGGPTWTHAPRSSSPAIDQATAGGLLTDQSGNPRTFDEPLIPNALDGSDMGAFEVAPVPPPVLQITATTTNTVVISWASPAPGFGLEHNSDLNPGWLEVEVAPSDDGTTKSIVVPASVGNQFFRMRKL